MTAAGAVVVAGFTVAGPAGGRATTGPWTGRLAMAGGGVMRAGAGRGWGITTRRTGAAGGGGTGAAVVGAGGAPVSGTAGATGRIPGVITVAGRVTGDTGLLTTGRCPSCGGAATGGRCCTAPATGKAEAALAGGRGEAGATVTLPRGGGADLAAASACFRSRIAFSASPGLDTCERLKLCRLSAAWRFPPPAGREPRLT